MPVPGGEHDDSDLHMFHVPSPDEPPLPSVILLKGRLVLLVAQFAGPGVESTDAVAGTAFTYCSCSDSAASAFSCSTKFAAAFAGGKCVTDTCSWHSPGRYVQGEVAHRSGASGCVVAWSVGRKEGPSHDFPVPSEPVSSSSGPASVPGLPVTEGEFPVQQTPLPEPTPERPAPEAAEDTDSDATVDYRETGLLALAAGDDDVLIRLPSDFDIPSFVPLDGDGFASWLTKQDRIKAGTLTPEMQRKYATEIRAAKLEEFKSYLDNDAIRLTDRRKLGRDVNFLTGRWVLTVKVDKNGYFSKFKARWVCRGDQQTDSLTALVMVSVWSRMRGQSLLGPFPS